MKEKYSQLTKDILLSLATAGVIVVAATSPFFLWNIARAVFRNRKYIKKEIDRRKVERAMKRLKKNRLIILTEKDGKFKVELSEKGKRKIKEIEFENMRVEKPSRWDKKWRIVIFDIPDKYKRRARDALREKLKELNFYQLQKSVWVHPYPCQKEIQFLCEFFDITPFVNIIVAGEIYNDVKLKKCFRLF